MNRTELQELSHTRFCQDISQIKYRQKRRALIHSLVGENNEQFLALTDDSIQLATDFSMSAPPIDTTNSISKNLKSSKKVAIIPLVVITVAMVVTLLVLNDGEDNKNVVSVVEDTPLVDKQSLYTIFTELTVDDELSVDDMRQILAKWTTSQASTKQDFMSKLDDLAFENEEIDTGLTSERINKLISELKVIDNKLIMSLIQMLNKRQFDEADSAALVILWQSESEYNKEYFVQHIKSKIIEWHADFDFEEQVQILDNILAELGVDDTELYASNDTQMDAFLSAESIEIVTTNENAKNSVEAQSEINQSVINPEVDKGVEPGAQVMAAEPTNIESHGSEIITSNKTKANENDLGIEEVSVAKIAKSDDIVDTGTNELNTKHLKSDGDLAAKIMPENILQAESKSLDAESIPVALVNENAKPQNEPYSQIAKPSIDNSQKEDQGSKPSIDGVFEILAVAFSREDWFEENNLNEIKEVFLGWRRNYFHSLIKSGMAKKDAKNQVNMKSKEILVKLENFNEIHAKFLELSSDFSGVVDPELKNYVKTVNGFWGFFESARD